MKRIFLFCAAVLVVSLVYSGAVQAVNPALSGLADQYRHLLETYRANADKLTLSLAQYASLQTLASQEEAVRDMRDFLLNRSDVVSTHLSILQADLSDRTLVTPLWIASSSGRIDKNLSDLRAHRSRSDVAVDRIKADGEALWFIGAQKELTSTADRAQCLIAIGHAQEAIASLKTVKQKIDTWIASSAMSETQRVEKRRGSDELGRTISSAESVLATTLVTYERQSQSNSSTLMYPQIRPGVLTAYQTVQRGVDFAKELSQ